MPYDSEVGGKVREAKKVLKSLNPSPLEVLRDLIRMGIKKILPKKRDSKE